MMTHTFARRKNEAAALIVALALLCGYPAHAQQPATATAQIPPSPLATKTPAEEQARILADTQRLFQLASELKLELVNGSPETLSAGIQKRAAEIEVLARSLHQRMKN